jgi:Pentapeptide repeats (8 copies)
LTHANLDNAILVGAYIDHANLSGASLNRAVLAGADLTGTNLVDARLFLADLTGADLTGTNLVGARLHGAYLKHATFRCSEPGTYLYEKYEKFDMGRRKCPNLKDIKWDKDTNWQGIQGWETVENIPPALQRQLGLKDKKEAGKEKKTERNP